MLWDEPKIFFLERRYFFSIILSEFLKNRVALQLVIHSNRDVEDIKDKEWEPDYFDSAPYGKGMVWTIYVTAENRELAQKIAYDKYAQWKAEREGIV